MQRGQRYAKEATPALVEFCTDELPFLSFDEARRFYRTIVPGLSDADMRYLVAVDRFFLLTFACKRKDAINEWVYDRCREVEGEPDERLDLWARYHYKSTIITFAGSLQEIINDPEITIAIFGNDIGVAQPFLRQLMKELEDNDDLKRLYPDIFWTDPRREAPTWNRAIGFVVKRKSNPKELTVQAFGIMDALPTGGHWALRIYNDIVTFKSVTTTDTDQIGKTVTQWELSQSLGTHEGGRRWHEGTRYHFADAYGVMLDRKSLTPRVYAATHDGTLNGRPVFLSDDAWQKIKRDQRKVVSAQFLLNPLAGQENTFFLDWLRPFEIRPKLLNVYILADPAGKPSTRDTDRTAMAVIGVDVNQNRYLLDGFCHKMRLSEKWEALRTLFTKWKAAPGVQMVRIGYEKYGMQTDTEYFEEKIYTQKIDGLTVDEISWTREGPQSKNARISRLEPYFKESQFWLPPKVWVEGKTCTWSIKYRVEPVLEDGKQAVDKKTGKMLFQQVEGSAEIIYEPVKGPTALERAARQHKELHRLMEPIRRLDQDGKPYDLFRVFLEQYRLHPFAPHDDFIDAMSRIQDIDPVPPVRYESMALESPGYADT